MKSPIDVNYDKLKDLLKGGLRSLDEDSICELLLLIPCFVMDLNEDANKAAIKARAAKIQYQRAFNIAMMGSEAKSAEMRRVEAGASPAVQNFEEALFRAEVEYDRLKSLDEEWLELQQALKRILDVKFRKSIGV